MKIISIFNNKGGVGKTTLTFHVSCALAALGKRVLMIDLDPQCNLTIYGMKQDALHKIWTEEDSFIDRGFDAAKNDMELEKFKQLNERNRTIHYILKPTEEGTGDLSTLPCPVQLSKNLDLIPGRLTLHMYEDKIASRWSEIYQGDPLAIRTITRIRTLAQDYAKEKRYDIVMVDTSPSLGVLNKVIISTVDGFIVPCFPDMFSLYGIRNIGNSLAAWKKQFDTIYRLISPEKRKSFPTNFVRFLGFTIYNAKKYDGSNPGGISIAAANFSKQIPITVETYIKPEIREHIDDDMLRNSIGKDSIMLTHNTMPLMAQKYNKPIWEVPDLSTLDRGDVNTVKGNSARYKATKESYMYFVQDLLTRIETLE
jgi:cellulose biosynthesis protein BcsQ